MKDMPEIEFPPEVEEMAIKLAAFDIMKQDNKERTSIYCKKT